MRLEGQTAAVLLTEDGRAILRLLSVPLPQDHVLVLDIVESEDLGLWVRLMREEQSHVILLQWHYILAIDIPERPRSLVGIRGGRPVT